MPGKRDITIYSGDTYVHEVRIKDSNGTPISITGRTYSGSVKLSKMAENVLVSFTPNIVDGANGVVKFSLTSSETGSLTPGTYHYDFQEVNNVVTTTLLTGKIVIEADVT